MNDSAALNIITPYVSEGLQELQERDVATEGGDHDDLLPLPEGVVSHLIQMPDSIDGEEFRESKEKSEDDLFPKDTESKVPQLLIDKDVTTLVAATKKGIYSISKPYKKILSVPTKSFCSKLDMSLSNSSPILLPRNTRYSVFTTNHSVLVLEEEPCIRSIQVNSSFESVIENLKVTGKLEEFGYTNFLNDTSIYRFTLSFPYIVYLIQLFPYPHNPPAQLCVFYRTAPLTSLYDELFKCNLLNVYYDGRCCLGNIQIPEGDVNTRVNAVLDSFWNSTFNGEVKESYNSYGENPRLSTFLHWEHYSSKDPMFIMSEELFPAGLTLASAISRINNGRNDEEMSDNYRSLITLLESDPPCQFDNSNSSYRVNQMSLSKNGITLDSGEEIVVKGEKYFVVDFLRNQDVFLCIRIESQKSGVVDVILDPQLKKSLLSQIKNRKYVESITVKDQEIKPGKIIKFSSPEEYTTLIQKILRDRDGVFLTKCGKDYYLLENVDFKIIEEDDIRVKGIKLDKGKRYIVNDNYQRSQFPLLYKFENINPLAYNGFTSGPADDDFDGLYLNFGGKFFDFDNISSYMIFPEENIEKLEFARYGQQLLEGCNRVKGVGLFTKSIHTISPTASIKLANEIVAKQELLVQSYDFDVKFSVGDKVIIPDWSRPETLKQIRTITGFKTAAAGSVDIISVCNEGGFAPSITEYLEFGVNPRVNIGSVRKISEEFNGIKAGFKMVAKIRGVQNFMKKDCYTVIGFITDTGNGIPLMLCSNLCTIWCTKQDLEKFDFFEPSSNKFSRLQVTQPSLSSIRIQPGDLLLSKRNRCCDNRVLLALNKSSFGPVISVVRPDDIRICKCNKDMFDPIPFYGIPSPRIKLDPKTLIGSSDFEEVSPYPGFHNTIFNFPDRIRTKIFVRREEKVNVSNLFGR